MKNGIVAKLNLLEAAAFTAVVALYIWRWQLHRPNTWIIFPVWLILSWVLHRDTPKTLGWRADNLRPATRQAAKLFALFIVGLLLVGIFLGGLHRLIFPALEPRRFLTYFAFCVLQEVGLQSLVMNRMLGVFRNEWIASATSAALFATLHWPNPVLVPLTFIGGAAFCRLFARERNIIPLAIGQAILGSLVWWAFPIAWHHGMRVGPGFYSFPH
ncbi:MAG TPA: CPBP family glutamic-type intramembrane protease [Terriglobales bacterium]|nr:CPBP family glutamic-type intramembrane protease [Terriglobales bacterium]